MEKLKKCSKCSRELPVSEFWKNASTEDGLQTYCKECGNVYARNRKKTPGGGGILKKYIPILNWQNFLHGNLSQN